MNDDSTNIEKVVEREVSKALNSTNRSIEEINAILLKQNPVL